jgi:hypothetical protein
MQAANIREDVCKRSSSFKRTTKNEKPKKIESQNEQNAAVTLENVRLISEVERITQIYNFLQNQEASTNNARSVVFKKFEKNHLADSLQEENSSESEESSQESDDDKMEDDSDSDSNEVRVSQQVSRFGHEHHP